MKIHYYLSLALVLLSASVLGQSGPVETGMKAISADVIKAQLDYLASDITEGRESGSRGEYIASEYIASMLQLYGVKPAGDYLTAFQAGNSSGTRQKSYFQNFSILKTTPGKDSRLYVITGSGESYRSVELVPQADFAVNPSGLSAETVAGVIFAGYGFKSEKLKYNDFANIDVKGKFIIRQSGIPAFAKEKLSPEEKASAAMEAISFLREHGAAGIIEFNPGIAVAGKPVAGDFMNTSPSENRPRPASAYSRYSLPSKNAAPDFPRIFVSARAASEILSGTGVIAEDFIKKEDNSDPVQPVLLPEKRVEFKNDIKQVLVPVRNVIGVIEGKDPSDVIVLGAHYDHMGMSNGYIWNGADDNASGTVGVMTVAKAIMATGEKPGKTIIIALWTAEEEGLLGSHYFVDNLSIPVKSLKLNVNFDMISRYISAENRNGVEMDYTRSFELFRKLTEANVKKFRIEIKVDYQPSDDVPGGSDHRSFAEAGIPVLRFKTSHPQEYHTPADETDITNWDIMEKIVRISFADIWDLANTSW